MIYSNIYKYNDLELSDLINKLESFATHRSGKLKVIRSTTPSGISALFHEVFTIKVSLPYSGNTIEFHLSEINPFKGTVTFQRQSGFEFDIFIEGIYEKIMKLFGLQDIKVPNQIINNKYIVQSNNKSLLNTILNENCQSYLLYNKVNNLTLKNINKQATLSTLSIFNELDIKNFEMVYNIFINIIDIVNMDHNNTKLQE